MIRLQQAFPRCELCSGTVVSGGTVWQIRGEHPAGGLPSHKPGSNFIWWSSQPVKLRKATDRGSVQQLTVLGGRSWRSSTVLVRGPHQSTPESIFVQSGLLSCFISERDILVRSTVPPTSLVRPSLDHATKWDAGRRDDRLAAQSLIQQRCRGTDIQLRSSDSVSSPFLCCSRASCITTGSNTGGTLLFCWAVQTGVLLSPQPRLPWRGGNSFRQRA